MNRQGVHPAAVWAALVLLNVFVYGAVGNFELVNWDDPTYITENPTVLQGLNWNTAWWAITTGHSPYWHPLTWMSHMLDISLFGSDAGAYHVTNLVLHVANTVLLFELLRRMTGAPGRSAFVAAMFAAHPLHVESVAWVTERKDVLSACFWLLTSLAYLGYVRRGSWRRYAGVAVLFAMALMSKPMVVTLPVVLLLLDIWPLKRLSLDRAGWWPQARALVIEKLPLLGLAMATSAATVIIQHRVGAMAGLDALPWHTRAANATIGYVAYLWKTVWPAKLAAFYPLFDISPARVVLAVCALLIVTASVIYLRTRHPYLLVGWFWYVITIAPVIGFLQAGEQGMADRFMYIPMIGLLIAAAWGVPAIVRGRAGVLRVAAVTVVVLSAVAAQAQVAHWENSLALWEHASRVTPESYIAHENLGQALRERGRLAEARNSYERALAHAPRNSPGYAAVIHNSIGMVLTRDGRIAEALVHFEAAVRGNATFAEAHSNLGNALAAEGRYAEAHDRYRDAIRLKPEYAEPHIGLGGTLLRMGKAGEAIPHYREALKLDPALAQAHNGLGGALATMGQYDEAMVEYREALRLKPDLATAHLNIALLFVRHGDLAQARRHLETAVSIDPGLTTAQQALRALIPKA
jgi:tetratricopeptide (TPR) repeat protein